MATYQASSSAANAPVVEEAMYKLVLVRVEAKRMATGKFVKNREAGDPKLEWVFQLVDGDGNIVLAVDSDGNPITDEDGVQRPVEVSKLTGVGFNIASTTVPAEVKMLKALLTNAEYKAFENGEGTPDDEEDAPAGLLGRMAQGEVGVKENGWPFLGNVVQPLGGQKGKAFAA